MRSGRMLDIYLKVKLVDFLMGWKKEGCQMMIPKFVFLNIRTKVTLIKMRKLA
jgi:hypothetical protein